MGRFEVCESFVSINGEGQKAGELALFIRFKGCNLECSWCDTSWANGKGAPFNVMTTDDICKMADEAGVKDITLTGGEPLLQADIGELITRLITSGHEVEIETNGSVELPTDLPVRPSFTMDYKLPTSGMESKMRKENFALLEKNDTVKFVCGSQQDLERAAQMIGEYSLLDKCKVYLSPVFGMIEPDEIVEFMKQRKLNGARLQLQLHKFIWEPNKRGV